MAVMSGTTLISSLQGSAVPPAVTDMSATATVSPPMFSKRLLEIVVWTKGLRRKPGDIHELTSPASK